jgi:hypothetical protein
MTTTRKPKVLVAELHHSSAQGVHSPPYCLGRDAGAALTAMYGRRQDHVTCAIEWYRGFCEGCGSTADPKIESSIAREALALKHGLDRAAIIIAGLDAITPDADEITAADRKAKKP